VNVIIRDLDQTRVHFEAAVQRVGEQEANRAFNRALNSEGDKVRTAVRRALRQQTGAKAPLINRETRSFRSTFSNLVYTIEARGDHLGLSHFAPRQFRYGVRAKPWGRFQRFEGAFLIGQPRQQRLRPRDRSTISDQEDVRPRDPEGDGPARDQASL